jgi:chloramphenicol 3-O-phosphotransferase
MESLEKMQNMIEHTLNMYADDFVLMPAFGLYEDKILQDFEAIIQNCHIYFVGEVPAVEIISIKEIERKVFATGQQKNVTMTIHLRQSCEFPMWFPEILI